MNQLIYSVLVAIIIWLGFLSYYLYRTSAHYEKLIKGTNKRSLLDVLNEMLTRQKADKDEIEALSQKIVKIIDENTHHVQKVGILRFNPFADTGGDQSFVLAILDGTDSGIVLTSLHNRGITRWYAKNVKNGEGSDHQLSEDEKKAIKNAVLLKTKKG